MEKLYDNVYRILIPFENVDTSVFVFVHGDECIIADAATTDKDVYTYIIPQIEDMGLSPKYLVSSHTHGDHFGGMPTLEAHYPNAALLSFEKGNISDGDSLYGRYKLLNLKGHCPDSLGILDCDTNTLFSFDSLQLRGIDIYRGGVTDGIEYRKSIGRLRALNLNKIIASHDYDPYGYFATGEFEVKRYLDECEKNS